MNNTFTLARGIKFGVTLAACISTLSQAQEAPVTHGPTGNWNDTMVRLRYADDLHFPGSANKVTQKIGVLTTVGGFKYGSYVFNVDFLVSDKNNPAAGSTTEGAQEVYSVGRATWSAGKILGHPVAFGPIRDVGLTTGYEFSSKNDAFEARSRMLVVGPSVDFAVPRGYWNATIGWRSETNYNGIVHKEVVYDTVAHLDSAWMIPFQLGAVPTVFKGFASITAPKGLDGFHAQTRTEVLTRMSLLVDVGALAGHPRTFYVGPGYEYWNNMFGTPASAKPGTHRSAAMLVGEIHF